jgi:pyridoxamine 5'-phosphate oxidase
MTDNLPSMRITYKLDQLGDSDVLPDPIDQFRIWFEEVLATDVLEANAMVVSTVDAQCRPSSRTVLMKRFDERGIVFFSNYSSQKGREIAANPYVSILFYWPSLQRQVRWSGRATRLPDEESDAYFRQRPRGSQIGAHVSPQSAPIPDREWLSARYDEVAAAFGEDGEVPRPENWGGFRVEPESIEFWQGRENRLHDRILYRLSPEGTWERSRIAP